jgi:nucleoside-diphosphate-sugar epimerase
MPSHTTSKIFVIGGTGAQGIPVIRALVADKKYSVRFLSRDSASRRAKDLLALDNVSILEGSFADEAICGKDSAVATEHLSTSTGSTPARRPRPIGRSVVTK